MVLNMAKAPSMILDNTIKTFLNSEEWHSVQTASNTIFTVANTIPEK